MKEHIDILSVVVLFIFLFVFITVRIFRYKQEHWKKELRRYRNKIKSLEDDLWLCTTQNNK